MEEIFGDEVVAQSKRDKDNERIREELLSALSTMMDSPHHRTLLCWLIESSRYFKVSYANNADVYRHEGMRQIGAAVVELLLEARPDALAVLKQHGKENFHG